jgi:hypothetical protein
MFCKCKVISKLSARSKKMPLGGLYNIEHMQFAASSNTVYFLKYSCLLL